MIFLADLLNVRNKNSLNSYFAFGKANPQGFDHLKSSNNNFGFEDMYGGGDRSFDDLSFEVNLETV